MCILSITTITYNTIIYIRSINYCRHVCKCKNGYKCVLFMTNGRFAAQSFRPMSRCEKYGHNRFAARSLRRPVVSLRKYYEIANPYAQVACYKPTCAKNIEITFYTTYTARRIWC